MPKLRQNEEQDTMKTFTKEIRKQGIEYGIETQEDLGNLLNIAQSTAGSYLQDPGRIRLKTLRDMVKKLRLDPFMMLKVLGYSKQDIRKVAKEYAQ